MKSDISSIIAFTHRHTSRLGLGSDCRDTPSPANHITAGPSDLKMVGCREFNNVSTPSGRQIDENGS